MKRSESPPDDQNTGGQRKFASGGQPPRKRIKHAEADKNLENDDDGEIDEASSVRRLKSMPEDEQLGERARLSDRAASPRMAAFEVTASIPPPPPSELAAQSFPHRLMEMLDSEVVPDAMWWTEEGKAFAMDLDKFGNVLHHHFQATKYASFTRKLNKWGFRKLNNIDPETPESVVVYRHELFQKGMRDLLANMSTKRKKKAKDSKKQGGSDDASESERKDTSEETDFEVQNEAEKEDTSDGNVGGTEEEKAQSIGQSSPISLTRAHQSFQGTESKTESASDFVRQQVQQQLSLASSLATHRMASQHTRTFSHESPSLASVSMQGGHGRTSLGTASIQRDPIDRQFIESLIARESQQHQRLELALLRQHQENLANEIAAQRQLAATASASRLPMHLVSAVTLEERLAALQDPAFQGIHRLTGFAGRINPPSRSHSMSDLPSAHTPISQRNLSDLAARLGIQQVQPQASDLALALSGQTQPQNLSELRAAMEARSQAEIASAIQLMTSPSSPAQARLSLPSDARLASLDLLSSSAASGMHGGLHHSQSFPDASTLLQMQLELADQREQLRRASSVGALSSLAAGAASQTSQSSLDLTALRSTAAVAGAASHAPAPSPADQQLLELLLERQRLQQQLQEEHRRRRQGR